MYMSFPEITPENKLHKLFFRTAFYELSVFSIFLHNFHDNKESCKVYCSYQEISYQMT
ncbi:hypothetical protein SDC9_192217 [bioreactor metagenome]|uniref:Uncharacterized protein n=1 Tax=bioreactor metagenome TaxID=1076179 RepID=A0A645I1N5_9ZZZZ